MEATAEVTKGDLIIVDGDDSDAHEVHSIDNYGNVTYRKYLGAEKDRDTARWFMFRYQIARPGTFRVTLRKAGAQ